MMSKDKLWISIGALVLAFPFLLITVMFRHYGTTMITDSIPHYEGAICVLALGGVAFITIILSVVLSFNLMTNLLKVIGITGFLLLICYDRGLFPRICENRIFASGSSSQVRAVKINGVYSTSGRGGRSYYAVVNPYRIKDISPTVPIDTELFEMANSLAKTDASKSPDERSAGCLIRVTVNKAGSAERIIWEHGPFKPADVTSCG